MTEHVGPIGDQFIHSAADGFESWHIDTFESALFLQYAKHSNGIRPEFVVAKQVYDVI